MERVDFIKLSKTTYNKLKEDGEILSTAFYKVIYTEDDKEIIEFYLGEKKLNNDFTYKKESGTLVIK